MRLLGMTIRWPWDHSKADAHADRVEEQEAVVERIVREGRRQKAENNIGALLGTLFVTPPKDRRP